MGLRASQVDAMWAKLGFTIDRGRKDIRAELIVEGRLITSTSRSHGSGKLDGRIPGFIRTQMHLTDAQFQQAYDCPLKKAGYIDILRDRGHLGVAPRSQDVFLEYPAAIRKEDAYFMIEFPDCPGCQTFTLIESEIPSVAAAALNGWIASALSEGKNVAPPRSNQVTATASVIQVRVADSLTNKLKRAQA